MLVASRAHARLDAAVVTPASRAAAGIVFAMPIEAGRFADRVTDTRRIEAVGLSLCEGVVAGRAVAWVVGGAGLDHAMRACRLLIDGHRPRLVIAAGFAGGLAPDLARGSVVRPARAFRIGHDPLELAGVESEGRARPLGIVTVDEVVCTAEAKRRLALDTAADLADMETWGVASEARAAGLPCECVRIISDAAHEELPEEVSRLTAARSPWRRLGTALRAVGSRPSAAVDLWHLWERAVTDSRALADALEHRLSALPATPA